VETSETEGTSQCFPHLSPTTWPKVSEPGFPKSTPCRLSRQQPGATVALAGGAYVLPLGVYGIMAPRIAAPRAPAHHNPIAKRSHTSQNDVRATRHPHRTRMALAGSIDPMFWLYQTVAKGAAASIRFSIAAAGLSWLGQRMCFDTPCRNPWRDLRQELPNASDLT
jgi:hypothetical protein